MPNRGPGPMFFTHNGQTKTLRQWAEQTGINYMTLYYRIRRQHIPLDRALNPDHLPSGTKPKLHSAHGMTMSLPAWAEHLGVSCKLLRQRLFVGMPPERVFIAERLAPRRSTKRYTVNGITKTLPEWAEYIGVSYSALAQRLTRYSLAEAIAIPPRRVVRRNGRPGVPSNLEGCEGTGAGKDAQEISEITFSEQAENA